LDKQIASAIRFFWETRSGQIERQQKSGKNDQGSRGAVTGGAQLDGFINLIHELLLKKGIPAESIFMKKKVDLPGFFRPVKNWDLLVVHEGDLLAAIEFKAQVGPSFGNNFNNRTEEAIGSSTDLWTAYRERVFHDSPQPWLGYFFLLEKAVKSISPVKTTANHFPIIKDYNNTSYAERYEIFCRKLMSERLYNSTCMLVSDRLSGLKGVYSEPNKALSFNKFVRSLLGHLAAHC